MGRYHCLQFPTGRARLIPAPFLRRTLLAAGLAGLLAKPGATQESQAGVLHVYSASDSYLIPLDPNGFLFNPKWFGNAGHTAPHIEIRCRFRVATSHLERRSLVVTDHDCLSADERHLLTLNEPPQTLGLGAVCVTGAKTGLIRGHVNWFPVTATGQLRWNSYSKGAGDHDVNTDFLTPVPNATTAGNDTAPTSEYLQQRMYHLEFYSHETLERIPAAAPGFWAALKRYLLQDDSAKSLVNDRVAIVTGLYGLDGVHGFQAELHPVYAMSVLISADSSAEGIKEEWAVMVRNIGSEGDCAYGTIPLLTSNSSDSLQDFVVDLGESVTNALPGIHMRDAWSTEKSFVPYAEVVVQRNANSRRLHLHFPHPRPVPGSKDFAFLGTLEVRWKGPIMGATHCPLKEPGFVCMRVGEWLPNYAHPAPTLTHVAAANATPGEIEEDPSEREGIGAPDPLLSLPQRDVVVADAVTPLAVTPRTYAAFGWPMADTVARCCFSPMASEPLSLSARRLVVGASGTTLRPRNSSALLGVYLYPHSGHYPGESTAADIFNFFTYFGYRADVRRDQFFPITKKDSVTHYGVRRSGYGFRLSPFLSPNSVQLSEHFALMPYTAATIGASYFKEDQWQWTWGWGLGLQAQFQSSDAFVEIQNSIRGGGYVNHWVYAAGLLFPLGR